MYVVLYSNCSEGLHCAEQRIVWTENSCLSCEKLVRVGGAGSDDLSRPTLRIQNSDVRGATDEAQGFPILW